MNCQRCRNCLFKKLCSVKFIHCHIRFIKILDLIIQNSYMKSVTRLAFDIREIINMCFTQAYVKKLQDGNVMYSLWRMLSLFCNNL